MQCFVVGQHVKIIPIEETGMVIKIRQDERGKPLVDVRRDSDGESHVCRPEELEDSRRYE